jgi:hypothetical protein
MELEAVGKALVRVMRNYRGIQYVLLTNISALAAVAPDMFRKYLKDFYAVVRVSGPWCWQGAALGFLFAPGGGGAGRCAPLPAAASSHIRCPRCCRAVYPWAL